MQYLQPTSSMADLLYSLQKFYIESDLLKPFLGHNIMRQNDLYILHYCSPLEKNLFLQLLLGLYFAQTEMPQQDILYIDNQFNFKTPDDVYVAPAFSNEDLVVQLNSARYLLRQNRKIRLLIIDSLQHWQIKHKHQDYRRRSNSRTIGEKILNFQNEVYAVIDELIDSLKLDFNAIVVVLSQQTQINNQQLKYQNQQIYCSKRIFETVTQQNHCFLFSS